MDPFTEGILERARERQKKILGSSVENIKKSHSATNVTEIDANIELSGHKLVASDSNINTCTVLEEKSVKDSVSEGNLRRFVRQSSTTRVLSEMPGSPQPQSKILNIQRDTFNMEIKVNSADNIRLQVEIQEHSDDDDDAADEDKENMEIVEDVNISSRPALRDGAKDRLQRLGKLYAGGEDANISSPIHRTEETFLAETQPEEKEKKIDDAKESRLKKGLGRLAALAKDINEWEDDLSTRPTRLIETPPKNCSAANRIRKAKAQAPKPPINEAQTPKSKEENVNEIKVSVSPTKVTPKQSDWDPKVLKSLESQGFTRTPSNSHLVYVCDKNESKQNCTKNIKSKEIDEVDKVQPSKLKSINMESRSPTKIAPRSPIKSAAISNKVSLFESSSPSRNAKDPALLSVSERKALFERNKGVVPIPRAPISLAPPQKTEKLPNRPVTSKPIEEKTEVITKSPVKQTGRNDTVNPVDIATKKAKAAGIASTMAALFENKTTISQQQIESSIKQQRQKEMDLLLNRFQRNKQVIQENNVEEEDYESDLDDTSETTAMITQKTPEIMKKKQLSPPSPPPLPATSGQKRQSGGRRYSQEVSPKVAAILDDVKRIKIVPPKEGRIYPCLSDIETATETETEQQTASATPNSSFEDNASDIGIADTSFGREILETVCKNVTPQKRPILDESTESDLSDVLDDMDDYLDEALTHDSSNRSGPTPPKQGRSKSPGASAAKPSHSFHYKKCSPKKQTSPDKFKTPIKNASPLEEESPTYVVEGDNVLPLTHTVSFYRRQQGQTPTTPYRQITRQPIIEEASENSSDCPTESDGVKTKMQQLLDEILKQQTMISQTSQAINLCYSTPEFTGSTELVEAEQFLLLATHRRSAAQKELENVHVTKSIVSHSNLNGIQDVLDKGTLTISNITLPLKKEYARALAATGGKGHHVICLVKYKEKVMCTPLVSTVAGSIKNPIYELKVPGIVTMEDVYSSFAINVEIYCLQAQEEILPHEVKYHINKKSSSKVTPKKNKQDNRLVKPPKESPAGPNAVRSPAFALMGYVIFNVQAIHRKQFALNNTPSMSPLTGTVEMNIKYDVEISVEHRGFLTMFEDVSGFGAWHRRWCYLNGPCLSYWKYPDDEKKKAPIDTIQLTNCITNKVGPVNKEICARLHTVLIETERPSLPSDKDSLVMLCKGNKTVIRHLLSADTKDEKNEWCLKLNKALTAIKMSGNSRK